MKQLLLLFFVLPFLNLAQTGIAVPEMTHCDTQIQNFLSTFDIPSATFAMSKNGKLVFSRAYGNASISGNEPTQPYHMFRVASVSKPITAIGIMKMVDNSQISLSDKVFGTGGILENHWVFSNANIIDNRVYDITVQMLLEHTAGWDRNVNCFPSPTSPYPWNFSGCDPIIAPLHVAQTYGQPNPVKEEHLIQYVLEKNLNHTPGTVYAYSNMGFLVLSEIIEEISGMDYEIWMRQEVLNPIGIYDMYIAENLLADKREREGEYQGNGYTTLDIYGSGQYVPWEYGGLAVDAMDGHGGWIATARDLTRLLVAVDGFTSKPDILSSSAITTMSTPSSVGSYYSKGWQVNQFDNWWHTGAIDGTATIFVRTSSEYTWAILLNKRVIDGNSSAFWAGLDNIGWNCLSGTTNFPTHDLFESPTTNASNLQANNVTANAMDLSWINGNGTSRVVVAKELVNMTANNNFEAYPLDGTDYTADGQYGSGDNLGDNSFIIYNGTGNSITLEGLTEDSDYAIRVYEYTKNTTNGNNALYLLGNAEEVVVTTKSLGTNEFLLDEVVQVIPNPAKDVFTIRNESGQQLISASITNVNGRLINKIDLSGTPKEKQINIEKLQDGMYFIKISSQEGYTIKKIIKQ
ncbi:serine hydrolase [Hyunsoonleella rubra]|uniref:Serine hydrolase n=1 Tax=Hyunsoonleella rubra TaxID=1737062 RepID=A0ABW5TBC0_9FLAO